MGYSSSAALFVSSDGHSLIDKIGIIPVTETIFTNFNMILALITLIIITIINPLMRPTNKTEIKEIDTNVFNLSNKNNDFRYKLMKTIESNRFISLFVGLCLLFLFFTFFIKKVSLDLNIVIGPF